MDFDTAPPMPVAEYRRFQAIIPGIDALYEHVQAILQHSLVPGADVLVIGAGGGREIEALMPAPNAFRITGVDPSQAMLDVARTYIPQGSEDRVRLIKGLIDDVPRGAVFAAATSVLVMHFLADDGAKADYLRAVRERLAPGAPYIHVDVSIEDDREAEHLAPLFTIRGATLDLPPDIASKPADFARAMRAPEHRKIVTPARNRTLLADNGFEILSTFFRSLWFTGWWARAI